MWRKCRKLRIPHYCLHGTWGTSGVSPGKSVLVSSGGMQVRFPPELFQQCHPSIHVDQEICGFPSRLSHEAFTRGFPTGLTHLPPWCESILGCKSSQCRENKFPWNGLRHWGTVGMVARSWSSSRHSCGERLLLRCDGTLEILSRPRRERIPPL